MKKILTAAAVASMATMGATTAFAHPDNGVKAPNECETIEAWTRGKVREGMSLDAVEKLLGCHGTFEQTVKMKTGNVDSYHFKRGSKILVRVTFRDGKVHKKYGYYSGL